MGMPEAPALAGIHHLKLPVADLARSREWYRTRLGYQLQAQIVEQGQLMGLALAHPNGGPRLALRLDPGRARAAAGFGYFAIGVPDKQAIGQLAARLIAHGEQHAGVHRASTGWILPMLHEPDGRLSQPARPDPIRDTCPCQRDISPTSCLELRTAVCLARRRSSDAAWLCPDNYLISKEQT